MWWFEKCLSINRYKSHFKRAEFWHRTGCHAPERKPGSRPGPHLDQNVPARCAAVAPASILDPLETRARTNDEIMPAWRRQTED